MRRSIIAAVLAVLAIALPPVGSPTLAARDASPAPGTARLYAFDGGVAGFYTKTFFYDTGSHVVAFDAQFTPALAEQAIAYLRARTSSPITHLVVTHPNPDKFNGAPAFRAAGARVVASRATAAAIPGVHAYKKAFFVNAGTYTDETYPPLATVDETFTGTMTLDLGDGQTADLRELSHPGVSSTQTVAFVPRLNALVVGDLVHHKTHAWLEGGIVDGKATPTLDGWIADLRELETLYGATMASPTATSSEPTVYGGRGDAVPLATAVAAQIAYLERADQIVADYVEGLGERKAELSGPRAGEHYAAIQKEFERAFPDYAFGDMIGFSVYGLVNAKL